jgi:outer membrane protein assembly factor BamB
MRSSRRSLGAGIAAALIAVFLIAACSSGESSSTSVSTSSSPGATATSTSSGGPATTLSTPARGAQWTTYDRDAARAGFAPDGPATSKAIREQWASPTLDGDVYAQPLLVGRRVIVATANNTVYALAASNGSVIWKKHLGQPVPASSLPCGNVDPVGITSTPVVDAAAGRIYAVGMVQPAQHQLFELELSTGRLVASERVDAADSDPLVQNQRAALTLSSGKLFIAFGGRFGDCGDYHGRLVSVAVSAEGVRAPSSYTLPTQREGGFWAPPGPVVATDGSLFIASGNSSSSGAYDYGNSVVHLSSDLRLLDWFAPRNWVALNAGDVDLGSTSPVLLPHGRLFQIGKEGTGYLLDTAHLGGIGGELFSGTVCDTQAFGGIARRSTSMFVPCRDRVVQVNASDSRFSLGWSSSVSAPGPTIVTGGAVWTVATGAGDLVAFDLASGRTVLSHHVGEVPSQFTSPAAGGGRIVVAAARKVFAFGP